MTTGGYPTEMTNSNNKKKSKTIRAASARWAGIFSNTEKVAHQLSFKLIFFFLYVGEVL